MFARWFPLLFGLSGLALHAATWRLWTPQDVFPQVPLFGFARDWPLWLDWAAFAGIVAAYLCVAITSYKPAASAVEAERTTNLRPPRLAPRARVAVLIASYLLAVTLDQNRLQVWVWHFAIVGLLIAFSEPDRLAGRVRVLTASIYLWSAVSKLNADFAGSIGPMLLGGLCDAVGLASPAGPAAERMAYGLPLCELAIGIAVLTPAWRAGLLLSLAMHAGLLLSVGPLGLGHTAGVLLWNAFFILQNGLLATEAVRGTVRQRRDRAGSVVLVAAVLFPAIVWAGRADPWQGWAVYAPLGTKAEMTLQRFQQIPTPPVRVPVWKGLPVDRVAADRWCRDSLGIPLNPGQATRVGVAAACAAEFAAAELLFNGHVVISGGLPIDAGRLAIREWFPTDLAWYEGYDAAFIVNMLPRRSQRVDWEKVAREYGPAGR